MSLENNPKIVDRSINYKMSGAIDVILLIFKFETIYFVIAFNKPLIAFKFYHLFFFIYCSSMLIIKEHKIYIINLLEDFLFIYGDYFRGLLQGITLGDSSGI